MRLTKRQLKRIIREERRRLLSESSGNAEDFANIMEQIKELLYDAFDLCGNDRSAEVYWFNTMTGCIDGNATMISMQQTLDEMGGGQGEEDMMEMGYNDGAEGKEPAHPDNEFYMINYEDGKGS